MGVDGERATGMFYLRGRVAGHVLIPPRILAASPTRGCEAPLGLGGYAKPKSGRRLEPHTEHNTVEKIHPCHWMVCELGRRCHSLPFRYGRVAHRMAELSILGHGYRKSRQIKGTNIHTCVRIVSSSDECHLFE